MSDAAAVLKTIKDEDVKYVDFRFTDSRGKWQHIAQAAGTIDEDQMRRMNYQVDGEGKLVREVVREFLSR